MAVRIVAAIALVLLGHTVGVRSGTTGRGGHPRHGVSAAAAGRRTAGSLGAVAADVASPDAILAAYYESLSGPAGKTRDAGRFLSLFLPGARLLPTDAGGHGGTPPHPLTPQTYLFNTEPQMLEAGFVAWEVSRRTESAGKILHVFSTYEVRHAVADSAPFVRGVASFHLLFDGRRWWIFDVLWQSDVAPAGPHEGVGA